MGGIVDPPNPKLKSKGDCNPSIGLGVWGDLQIPLTGCSTGDTTSTASSVEVQTDVMKDSGLWNMAS